MSKEVIGNKSSNDGKSYELARMKKDECEKHWLAWMSPVKWVEKLILETGQYERLFSVFKKNYRQLSESNKQIGLLRCWISVAKFYIMYEAEVIA